MRRLFALLAWLFAAAAAPAMAAPDATERAIESLLAEARGAAVSRGCDLQEDDLARILCEGRIRIGVRSNYPAFGISRPAAFGDARSGYEVDIARALAGRLGVGVSLVSVTPANRIATLREGQIDLLLATLGHTVQRDAEIRFIRPHYFRSQTVLVGDRRLGMEGWEGLRGRTVCVPLGNADSALLSERGARLLIFDNPQQMLDALRLDICTLAVHDDTFFADSFADPHFAARFGVKLGISFLPWGMAVAREGGLARLLDLLGIAWHADGRFLELARRNRIGVAFLEGQQLLWNGPACIDETGGPRPACLQAPADTTMPRTSFAPQVESFEAWVKHRLGIRLELPMLVTETAWSLFLTGIVYSLVLVAGALASTLGFAVLLGALLCSANRPLRLATRAATTVLQCSPLVLLMFFAYAVASTLFAYSAPLALVLAILMIGLYNGSYASHAIAETHAALAARAPPGTPLLRQAVRGASVQIMSFLVNATKGSAVASMIGVPELLNALTDITSFTSERIMTYSLLLAFYAALVMLVVWLTGLLRRRLDAAEGTA